MRVPYELVLVQVDTILMNMILIGDLEYWWDYHQAYIKACGWSDEDFNKEILYHVDAEWDFQIWN
jgi:hypothetical protein